MTDVKKKKNKTKSKVEIVDVVPAHQSIEEELIWFNEYMKNLDASFNAPLKLGDCVLATEIIQDLLLPIINKVPIKTKSSKFDKAPHGVQQLVVNAMNDLGISSVYDYGEKEFNFCIESLDDPDDSEPIELLSTESHSSE